MFKALKSGVVNAYDFMGTADRKEYTLMLLVSLGLMILGIQTVLWFRSLVLFLVFFILGLFFLLSTVRRRWNDIGGVTYWIAFMVFPPLLLLYMCFIPSRQTVPMCNNNRL